jgi:NMD protein affecting ribosome stability and mRNA decay
MAVVICPVCGHETKDPEPEWLDAGEVIEEVCSDCEREWYADQAAQP